MSITVLLEASPRRASDGVVQTLRMVWNARKRADFFNQQWLPVLHLPPSFETDIGFDGTNFGQGALPNIGTMQIILDKVTAAWPGLIWKNAALTIKAAPWPRGGLPVDAADGDFVLVANAKAASISAADSLLTLVVLDAGEVLRRPVQPVLFGTSGIALLDGADAKDHFGSPVPVGWGVLSKVRGKLVDRTNLIYCFLGRAATATGGFFDGGASFTLGVARANLAALIANTPADGTVDYCLNAAGLVLARPWAKPTYLFTADLTASSTQAADIANAIGTSRTALVFGSGVVATFNGIQAAPCGLYVDDSRTIAEALDQLLAGLGAFWRLTRAGDLDIKRVGLAGTAAVTLGSWQVAKIERKSTVMPTSRRTLGYAHNNTVHGENDIAKLLTDNLAYADGTAIDALRPAAVGATKNIVTYSSTAPSSPVNGVDIWVDTSVTPNITKYRVAGAWQPGANYVTQGADIGVANGATNSGDLIEHFDSYATFADLQRAWTTSGTISLWGPDGNMTGGKGMRLNSSGAYAETKRRVPYAYEDLYQITIRYYINAVGTGNLLYVGFAGYDATGAILTPTDYGSNHYPVAYAESYAAGFHTFTGYFRGRAATSAGNDVGGPAHDPSSPTPAKNTIVSFAPAIYAATGGSGGDLIVDFIECRKVEDLTPLPPRAWVSTDFQAKGQVVIYLGRSWIARIDNTAVTPPSTSTGTGTWGLLADRTTVTRSTSAPASPIDSDVWVDTSVTPNVTNYRVGGAWVVGANYVTQGTDIGVANGATKNVVTYSSTAPASPVNGVDIWVDTGVTPNITKYRVGGAWVAGANYTTQGSDIGVANGATKNVVTYASTAPASPVNGVDIWVDTSVTPNVTKYRVGGAWVAGANYTTQGSDIGVENGATLNNAADEMNRNSSFEIYTGSAFPGWAFVAVHPGIGSSGVFAVATGFDLGRGPTMLYVSGDTYFFSEAMPVTPGETLWVEIAYYVDKGTGGTQTMGDTASVYFTARFGASSPFSGTDTVVVNAAVSYPMNRQVVLAKITVPAGMLSMALHGELDYNVSGSQAKMFVGNFSVSRRQPGADVTATQPVVQRLSTATGQALANFVLANGLNPASIVAAGFNRDGDSVSFASTLAAVPKIFFLPGGNAATAGQNVSIQAVGLTTSGFTMKAKSQAVTPGSLVTDGSATTGGGANPDKVINRTSSSHPYDNQFKFNFSVTVGNISAGEPGQVEVAIYVKQSGAWSNVGGQSYSATGTYNLSAFASTADFAAGDEFGISVVYAEGTGSVLSAFNNVKYTPGTVTETSLTPSGASDIPWIAIL